MRTQILGILTLIAMLATFYAVFIYAPDIKDQGVTGRIVLIHVPIAILGLLFVVPVFVGNILYLIKRDLKFDRFASCAAEITVLLISLTLATGMIWAKPIWGDWWVWDPRLTLELILWLTLVGYFMLRAYLPDREKKAKLSSVLGILAMINAPINYMVIRITDRTQHPQPIIAPSDPNAGMAPEIANAMMISFIAFTLLFVYLFDRRLKVAKIEDEVDRLESVVLAQ